MIALMSCEDQRNVVHVIDHTFVEQGARLSIYSHFYTPAVFKALVRGGPVVML